VGTELIGGTIGKSGEQEYITKRNRKNINEFLIIAIQLQI
jgi:hypothetical protein